MILLALFAFLLGISFGGVAVNWIWDHQNIAPTWFGFVFYQFMPAVPGLMALALLPIHVRAVILALRKGKSL